MTRPTAHPELDRNHLAFRRLLASAQAHLHRGRPAAAAASAQVAAQFAWLNPCGIFASAELEELLVEIARGLPPAGPPLARASVPRTVLHVATQAYQTGGSTQFIASWADQDAGRHHVVCVTRQLSVPVPVKLGSRESLTVRRIDGEPGGILARAVALRRLAAGADVILVHAHPCDVVPVLALGAHPDTLPPVVYVDQADHVFWVGVSIAQSLLSMRKSGAELAVARRGVDASRPVIAMRPLQFPGRQLDRVAAKRALGVDPSDVVVVTAADASKYDRVGPRSLVEMILPVFAEHGGARLLAAGPAPEGEWARAEAWTQGRVRALGQLTDPSILHQAADIYLDSFPFSSLTSLLESGSLGNPVVTFRGHPDECAVLGADTIGVDEQMFRPRTPDDLRRQLVRLIEDGPFRIASGVATRRAVVERHGAGWLAEAERVYRHAAASTPVRDPGAAERGTGQLEELVRLVVTRSPHSQGIAGAVRGTLGLLPLPQRLSAAAALRRNGVSLGPVDLLPDRSRVLLTRAKRAAERTVFSRVWQSPPATSQGARAGRRPGRQLNGGNRPDRQPEARILLEAHARPPVEQQVLEDTHIGGEKIREKQGA
ncbi:glycosyltransferase [Georgenia yuyongxinii]|uniref:Glycosyltransferase family 4 protein n=1 Tax=Georgenia yuyongxinii TaxID=2589797 RepID=A0A552WLN2_9MICO|nr:glycosyltransferase [Georgenia yuyongxinii]TRW43574.1 glycosyltransferase family 4 protein [Georgenia yuyongxinii]